MSLPTLLLPYIRCLFLLCKCKSLVGTIMQHSWEEVESSAQRIHIQLIQQGYGERGQRWGSLGRGRVGVFSVDISEHWPHLNLPLALPRLLSGKESACQCMRHEFDPSVWKIPCRGIWQPTPLFLPEKFQAQRILANSSPRGHKESDATYTT